MTCIGVIDAKAVVESDGAKLINILGQEDVTVEEERPVSVQLIGSEIEKVAEAAGRIERFASVIDLNFGCPIKRFLDRGCGGMNLLRDPGFIAEMVGAVVENVTVPVTAKIRIGICGGDIDVSRIARSCEAGGASAIIVHARSGNEGFSGEAHWDADKEDKGRGGHCRDRKRRHKLGA